MARLIILCGLPGSGKTTVGRRIAAADGAVRMCVDEWMNSMGVTLWDAALRARLERAQWEETQGLLLAGRDVVLEWGTWAREERDVLLRWCRDHGVLVSLVHLDLPLDEVLRRLAVRNTRPGETEIPLDDVAEWAAGPWQPPTADEIDQYDPYELPPPGWTSRPWQAADIPFLWEALYLSIHVREGHEPLPRSVLDDYALAHYLRDFGRHAGDDAQVVVDESGAHIAAAYCRYMGADDPGWGFVRDDVPELGMAVVERHRGNGIGRRVLEDLLARNPSMSLSVDDENDVARRLYESLGFELLRRDGTAFTMIRTTQSDRPA
jgi:predicted kinase/ribosomal protein S18 acetylase RimI-like enzyme